MFRKAVSRNLVKVLLGLRGYFAAACLLMMKKMATEPELL